MILLPLSPKSNTFFWLHATPNLGFPFVVSIHDKSIQKSHVPLTKVPCPQRLPWGFMDFSQVHDWLVVSTVLKNMKVNGKDDIPYIIMENKVHVPNHQSVNHYLTTIIHY